MNPTQNDLPSRLAAARSCIELLPSEGNAHLFEVAQRRQTALEYLDAAILDLSLVAGEIEAATEPRPFRDSWVWKPTARDWARRLRKALA